MREAVNFDPQLTNEVYATEAALARYPEIATAVENQNISLNLASPEVLASISGNAQELVAIRETSQRRLNDWLQTSKQPNLIAILNNARDPGNVGTIIRVADAFGADAVMLTGDSVEITNPKVVRSTAGSLFHLPVFAEPALGEVIALCQGAGLQILAADGSGDLELPLPAPLQPPLPTAWLFGNEAWGLTQPERDLADHVIRVPIYGHAESLNLATAATVCLWESTRHATRQDTRHVTGNQPKPQPAPHSYTP